MTKSAKRWQFLILALVVSLSFQLLTIGKWSVWHDEGYTDMLIDYPVGEVVTRTGYDVHPPLYYLVLKGWQAVVGSSEFALRSLSVIFMLLTIAATYFLVRKLWGERSANWALLPLSLAPVLIRYGQEMRMYAMVSLIGIAATYILVTLLKDGSKLSKQKRLGLQVSYALLILSLLYSHYFSVFIPVVHWLMVVGYLVDTKQLKKVKQLPRLLLAREWRWWVVSYVAVIVGFLPWLPKFITQTDQVSSGFWINEAGVHSFLSTISAFVLFRPVWMHWELTNWYAVLAFATAAICFVIFRAAWKGHKSWLERSLLIGYFVVPPLLLFLISMPPRNSVYYDRYLTMYAPMFFAALGVGLAVLAGKTSTRKIRKMPLVGVVLALLLGFGIYNASVYGNNYGHTTDENFNMKQLSGALKPQYMTGDQVVVDNLGQYFNARFYLKPFAGEPKLFAPGQPGKYGNTSLIFDRPDLLVRSFGDIRPTSKTVWVISGRSSTESFLLENVPYTWTQLPGQVSCGDATLTGFHVAF